MSDREVNETPPERWMRRLKTSNIVFLVKEQQWASVCAPWVPPEPGYRTGYLSIRRIVGSYLQPAEQWHIGISGKGLDGKQLMLPAEGHLADDEVPLNDLHKIYERLENLEEQVRILKYGWIMRD